MRVHIPSSLFSYTAQAALVEASGMTVAQALDDLNAKFPGLRFRIIDEQDQIRAHIKIFVNSRQIEDLSKGVSDLDEIHIVQAFSGG